MMISYVFKVIAVLSLLLSFGFRVNAQVPIDDIKGLEYQIRQCERIGAEPGGAGHKNLDKPNIDGVINPVVWFDGKTENRILYVLKEPWGDGGRNLPQEI